VADTDKKSNKRTVVIGGGTGSFALLSEMKHDFSELTALVNMVDDGGSTGVLRDELGVLPPGDIRQCLVALSNAPESLRRLFRYRFDQGTFAGHSFGNLFLSATERMTDSFDQAVSMAAEVLQVSGQVVPMTLDKCTLHMRTSQGDVVGQRNVELCAIPPTEHPIFWLEPTARISGKANQAIADAELIVIAPGSLYSSLVPALLVDGVASALESNTQAPVVYVANLVNKSHQTADFGVHDYVAVLEDHMGNRKVDVVLYNNDHPQADLLERYALDGEYPVLIDVDALKSAHYKAIGRKLLNKGNIEKDQNDTRIARSLIRHDGRAVSRALRKLAR
jgi:uncharacterized cofD-like protein